MGIQDEKESGWFYWTLQSSTCSKRRVARPWLHRNMVINSLYSYMLMKLLSPGPLPPWSPAWFLLLTRHSPSIRDLGSNEERVSDACLWCSSIHIHAREVWWNETNEGTKGVCYKLALSRDRTRWMIGFVDGDASDKFFHVMESLARWWSSFWGCFPHSYRTKILVMSSVMF